MTNFVWTGGSGDSLTTAANWNPAGVPGASDTATFDKDASKLQGSLSVSQFTVTETTHGDVSVAIKSGSITASSETIGNDGTVHFDLDSNSNTVSGSLIVGNLNTAIAEYHMDGGTVSVGTNEIIGMFGDGTFHQESGTHTITGNLTLGQSGNGSSGEFDLQAGTLTVNGNEIVGGEGKGEVGQDGGTHIVKGTLTIGGQGGPESTFHLGGGTLTVGTLATQTNEVIGAHADGHLDQTAGSNTVTGGVTVGLSSLLEGSGTEGRYTLNNGSQFTAANLTIGVFGKGTVDVNSNSTATISGPTNLGTQTGSNGTLEVRNGATFTASGVGTASTINVGVNATGVLDIEDGGTVTANFVTMAVNASGNTGAGSSITGSGSLLTVNNDLTVGKLGGATLEVKNQGAVTANHLVIGSSGQGAMLVESGAQVASKTSIEIGAGSGSQGAIAVVGATLSAVTTLTIGASGTGGLAGGSGGVVTAASVIVGKTSGIEAGSANLSGPLKDQFQGSLTINASSLTNNGGIDVDDNSTLHIATSVMNNTKSGSVLVNAGGVLTFDNSVTINNQGTFLNQGLLEFTGTATLQGGGKIIQSDTGPGPVSPIGGATLINLDNTYSGAGSILVDLVNQAKGTINGNGSNFALTINNNNTTNNGIIEGTTAKGVIIKSDVDSNAGTIEALGSNARLEIDAAVANTSKGVILASGAGAHIDLDSALVTGGTFKTALGGVIDVTSTSTINGVTNSGALTVTDGTSLHVAGSIFNNAKTGVISIFGDTNNTKLFVDNDMTLQGGGKIMLTGAAAKGHIESIGSDITLTNVDNVISGAGKIGDTHLTLDNQAKGVINGNDATHALTIDTGSHKITNSGIFEGTTAQGLIIASDVNNANLIEALGTNAKVEIDAVVTNNTKGTLLASGTGAHVDLIGATIGGGTLRTVGTGAVINVNGTSRFDGASTGFLLAGTGNPVNIAGAVNVNDGSTLQLKGTISNAGVITVASTGNETDLTIIGAVILDGKGQVTLTDHVENAIESNGSAASLTNVANTISGAGTIDDDNLTLDNQAKGVINAIGTHELLIDVGTFINGGKLEATGSGGLIIADTTITNGPKALIATLAADAHIDLDGVTIAGGLMTVIAGSTIDTLNDHASTIGATKVTNAGTIIADHGNLTITGAVANTGVLAADDSILDITGAVTGKGGTGTIAHDGTLEFGAASSALVTFLDATGSLRLDTATTTVSKFTGTIANFGAGNDIDLGAIDYTTGDAQLVSFVENAALTSGVLTVTDGTHALALTFMGNYTLNDFTTQQDVNHHVDLLHV